MYTYSFEKLTVWIEAKEFTKNVYSLTSKFPDSERFGLTSQLRRASVSICSNIAEGSSRNSFKDKAHFTTIAFGSAVEVLNQLIISFELGFISETEYFSSRSRLECITNKLNALRNYQIQQINKLSNPPIDK
ncbi:hypothetical protein D3C87_815560 [compost metagenome]